MSKQAGEVSDTAMQTAKRVGGVARPGCVRNG